MKIKLLLVGKNKDSFIENYISEYEKRIKHFNSFDIKFVKESKAALSIPEQKKAEATFILKELGKDDFLVLLDEKGDMFTSVKFSDKLKTWQQSGKKNLVFLVGGAYGVDESIKQNANATMALSQMTFTHQMVRVFFVEQLYRAFTIINKMAYHH